MPSRQRGDIPCGEPAGITILIPIFNDWDALQVLLSEIDELAADTGRRVAVLAVDDASTTPAPPRLLPAGRGGVIAVRRLVLRRNLGHQRAIAVGLAHLYANAPDDLVVVMDGDGEDSPAHIASLIDRCRDGGFKNVVFAARRRRIESGLFKLGYLAYRVLHRLLTGIPVRIGNFSVVPPHCLERLVVVTELWNHYAAAVVRSGIGYELVPADRRRRHAGKPKMNFVSLVSHGLSAVSVFSEIVGVRLLCGSVVLLVLCLSLLAGALFLLETVPIARLFLFILLLSLMLFQLITVATVFVFVILAGRRTSDFIPLRDYKLFVLRETAERCEPGP